MYVEGYFMVNAIPTYSSSVDPISLLHIHNTIKTAPVPLVQSAKIHPSVVDNYGVSNFVSQEAKKAADMYDSVSDFKLKNKYNLRQILSCHTKASEICDSMKDDYIKGF